MDADYDENSQITLNENRGKKKSSFSKALHTAKPTFDPGKDITACVYIFNSFTLQHEYPLPIVVLFLRCISNLVPVVQKVM